MSAMRCREDIGETLCRGSGQGASPVLSRNLPVVPYPRESLHVSPVLLSRARAGGLFHLDGHAHPRMDAALKMMFALGEASDLELAALQDSGSGHSEVLKSARTFGNGGFPGIRRFDKAATEVFDFCKGVRLTALIDHNEGRSFSDVQHVRLKVPAWVGSSSRGFGKQVCKFRGESHCD